MNPETVFCKFKLLLDSRYYTILIINLEIRMITTILNMTRDFIYREYKVVFIILVLKENNKFFLVHFGKRTCRLIVYWGYQLDFIVYHSSSYRKFHPVSHLLNRFFLDSYRYWWLQPWTLSEWWYLHGWSGLVHMYLSSGLRGWWLLNK